MDKAAIILFVSNVDESNFPAGIISSLKERIFWIKNGNRPKKLHLVHL